MLTWFRRLRQAARRSPFRLTLECLEERNLLDASGFVQIALVSDIPSLASHTDRDLINPWGFSETPTGQFRVSANGAGNAPLFTAQGNAVGPAVVIPPPLGSAPGTTSTPNGNVFNTTKDFVISDDGRSAPATVIFSTEDGTIAAFNPKVDPTHAVLAADQSASGAVYKLLALGSNSQGNFLFATDFHNNKIDVFDKNFHKVTLGTNGFGTFTDPNAPAGFAPFGIKDVNGTLFVTYAKQKAPDNHDDQEGPGNGFIDEFDTSGHFLQRFASGTAAGGTLTQLNSPIGMAVAPPGYGPGGKFGGALLVGNFGDSHVSAFDLKTGAFLGQLSDAHGNPLTLNDGVGGSGTKGLWGIGFGNGVNGADTNTLFFAAGINNEADGLLGEVKMSAGDHDHDEGSHDGHDSMHNGMTRDGQGPDHQALQQVVSATDTQAGVAVALARSRAGTMPQSTSGMDGAANAAAGQPSNGSVLVQTGAPSATGQTTTSARGTAFLTTPTAQAMPPNAIDLVFADFDLSRLG